MNPEDLGDGAKSSVERFVDNATDAERRAFYDSERVEDLYKDRGTGGMPEPRPTGTHVAYMLNYLEDEYGFPL